MLGLHQLSTPICLHPNVALPHQIYFFIYFFVFFFENKDQRWGSFSPILFLFLSLKPVGRPFISPTGAVSLYCRLSLSLSLSLMHQAIHNPGQSLILPQRLPLLEIPVPGIQNPRAGNQFPRKPSNPSPIARIQFSSAISYRGTHQGAEKGRPVRIRESHLCDS
jgi:hypothetical protein